MRIRGLTTPRQLLQILAISAIALSTSVGAAPVLHESDWIKPETGQQEHKLGARVESIETNSDSGEVTVNLSLPKSNEDIEEVTVMGRRSDVDMDVEPAAITQPSKVEFFNSPERNGIVIHLPKSQDFVLRINYTEPRPDIEPDRIRD